MLTRYSRFLVFYFFGICFFCVGVWATTPTVYAQGATLNVDTDADYNDAAHQVCNASIPNDCSLRGAISKANADPSQAYTINLPANTYRLTKTGADEDANGTGDLDIINQALTIVGAGAKVTFIQAGSSASNAIDRVFEVQDSAQLTLQGVAVRYGAADSGGGILNRGKLIIQNSLIANNHAVSYGGGIYHDGLQLRIESSTIADNTNDYAGGGLATHHDNAMLINSTFSANQAAFGGAIWSVGITEIQYSTLVGNSANYFNSGGIDSNNSVSLNSTLIFNNYGGDCTGVLSNQSVANLISDGSCFGDFAGDPKLGPLQDNGGGVTTYALQAGSPAIDQGDNSVCPATDARGVQRNIDGDGDGTARCDIGAYEAGVPTVPPVPTPTPSITPTPTPPPTGNGTINFNPLNTSLAVSSNATVDLALNAVQNLYGAQVEVAFDPAIVQVVDADPAQGGVQIADGGVLTPEVKIKNSVDNSNGALQYAISLQGNKAGVNGSGVLAQITFLCRQVGSSALTFTRTLLSDPQSLPVAVTLGQQGQINCTQPGVVNVQGQVILERRGTNYAGAQVCDNKQQCTTTTANGNYALTNVNVGSTLTVTHPSYLRTLIGVPANAASPVTLPTVTLLGGDVNQDNKIDAADAVVLGLAWNSTASAGNWNPNADITNDGHVDIYDMVAVQYNLCGFSAWPVCPLYGKGTQMAAAQVAPLGSVFGPTISTKPGAQTNTTTVGPDPLFLSALTAGQVITTALRVDNVQQLYGFDLGIRFDPQSVQVRHLNPGDFLDVNNQFVVVNQVDNVAGRLELMVTQTYPAVARNGSGILGAIQFEVKKPTTGALFHIAYSQLLNDDPRNPQNIPATVLPFLVHLPWLQR
ncbi:MAG: choice-of-anchor Q domain-containing protein [Caldilineaceae bacterium]